MRWRIRTNGKVYAIEADTGTERKPRWASVDRLGMTVDSPRLFSLYYIPEPRWTCWYGSEAEAEAAGQAFFGTTGERVREWWTV